MYVNRDKISYDASKTPVTEVKETPASSRKVHEDEFVTVTPGMDVEKVQPTRLSFSSAADEAQLNRLKVYLRIRPLVRIFSVLFVQNVCECIINV